MNIIPVDILLVEDRPADVELTLHALKDHKLVNHIHVVNDGEAALEFLFGPDSPDERKETPNPKLILLDLKLPKVDGIEVLRQIKSDGRTKRIPVVVLTSSREERDLGVCYDLGVNSYIVKPVEFENFEKAVRDLGMYWMLLNEQPS